MKVIENQLCQGKNVGGLEVNLKKLEKQKEAERKSRGKKGKSKGKVYKNHIVENPKLKDKWKCNPQIEKKYFNHIKDVMKNGTKFDVKKATGDQCPYFSQKMIFKFFSIHII